MNDHISSAFDEDLDVLNSMLSKMGGLAITQLRAVMDALAHAPDTFNALIENDRLIDELEAEINEKVVEVIAVRAPIAKDLRVVLTALKIAQMLERVGDYASNIAKRGQQIAEDADAGDIINGLQDIGHLAGQLMVDIVDALKHEDGAKAQRVWESDLELDQLHNHINSQIVNKMGAGKLSAVTGSQCLFALKNIERIGDFATGIAEQVWFRIHGEEIEGIRPKESTTV